MITKEQLKSLKRRFFSELKDDYPNKAKNFIKLFIIEKGEKLTKLYLKSDVITLT